jgi:hypothetical protein
MRTNHWSCSKFADRLRGTKKPYAESSKGWKEWEQKAKAVHPIRYWLTEEALDNLQKIIYWPVDKLYNMKYYVINRWVDQSHALVAHPKHIRPGQYRDFDYRMLVCLFDELVDFVEIEKAYSNYRWDKEKQKGMKWWQVGRWRTRTWRSAEAGLAHLEWETSLTDEEWLDADKKHEAKPTHQAEVAKEIIALYKWWTEVWPNRPDAMEASGWSAYCDDKRNRDIDLFDDDPDACKWDVPSIIDKMNGIEKIYEEEDTEMLIRLIKIRKSLWT